MRERLSACTRICELNGDISTVMNNDRLAEALLLATASLADDLFSIGHRL